MCQLPRSDRMAKSIWLSTLRYISDNNNLGKRCNLNPLNSPLIISILFRETWAIDKD